MGRPEEEVTAIGRAEILDTAKQYVTQDRQATHGKPEDSFGRISGYWSAHLKREVTRQDVAVMMTLLKVARLEANPENSDNWWWTDEAEKRVEVSGSRNLRSGLKSRSKAWSQPKNLDHLEVSVVVKS